MDEEGRELPAELPGVLLAQIDLVIHAVPPDCDGLPARYLPAGPGARGSGTPVGRRWAGAGPAYSGTAASSAGRRRSASPAGIRLASTAITRQASAMPASGSHGMTTRTDGARPSRPCRRPVTVAAVT